MSGKRSRQTRARAAREPKVCTPPPCPPAKEVSIDVVVADRPHVHVGSSLLDSRVVYLPEWPE